MARAYTAWVLQSGEDDDAEYMRAGTVAGHVDRTRRLTEATQFARRVDARRVAAVMMIADHYKAREKHIE